VYKVPECAVHISIAGRSIHVPGFYRQRQPASWSSHQEWQGECSPHSAASANAESQGFTRHRNDRTIRSALLSISGSRTMTRNAEDPCLGDPRPRTGAAEGRLGWNQHIYRCIHTQCDVPFYFPLHNPLFHATFLEPLQRSCNKKDNAEEKVKHVSCYLHR